MRKAGVYSVWNIDDLNGMIWQLSEEGYRIVNVFQTDNGMFHVVAQEYEATK